MKRSIIKLEECNEEKYSPFSSIPYDLLELIFLFACRLEILPKSIFKKNQSKSLRRENIYLHIIRCFILVSKEWYKVMIETIKNGLIGYHPINLYNLANKYPNYKYNYTLPSSSIYKYNLDHDFDNFYNSSFGEAINLKSLVLNKPFRNFFDPHVSRIKRLTLDYLNDNYNEPFKTPLDVSLFISIEKLNMIQYHRDIFGISQLTNLKTLRVCSDHRVNPIAINKLTNLTKLTLFPSRYTDYNITSVILSNLTNLIKLEICAMPFKLCYLYGLKNLTRLKIHDTNININAKPFCIPNLKWLELDTIMIPMLGLYLEVNVNICIGLFDKVSNLEYLNLRFFTPFHDIEEEEEGNKVFVTKCFHYFNLHLKKIKQIQLRINYFSDEYKLYNDKTL